MNEREYDKLHNEGGYGYNPYRVEREDKEREEERNHPKTRTERKYAILRELEHKDSSIARECGTYDQAEVDRLRAGLDQIYADEKSEFLAIWTPEVTAQRRAEWNARVSAGEFGKKKVDANLIYAAEKAQGWKLSDLQKAVGLHNK